MIPNVVSADGYLSPHEINPVIGQVANQTLPTGTIVEITVPNEVAAAIAAASDRQQIILVRLSPNAPFPTP